MNDQPTADTRPLPPARPEPPRWTGALAGVAAAGTALSVGQVIDRLTNLPGLVLAVGELVIDVVPGVVARESIENLGAAGKANLQLGITVTALLIGALLGRLTQTRHRWIGPLGFAAFGLFGLWALARYPDTATLASIVGASAATGVGIGTLTLLLNRAKVPSPPPAVTVEDPRRPAHNRRSFLQWTSGAGALAVVGVGASRFNPHPSRTELARAAVTLPNPVPSAVANPLNADGVTQTDAFNVPGLSPWLTSTENDGFYRIDTALRIPQVELDTWALTITGLVNEELSLTYDDLLAMDLVERTVTLSCVSNPIGGELVGNAVWLGVPLNDVLEMAGVQPTAEQIVGRSVDGFTAGFPRSVLDDGRSAPVAVGMNGEPLPLRHGFPARLIVAGLYGYVSATKWLDEIRLTTWDGFDGYWIPRGWSKLGPMKVASRIDVPSERSTVTTGVTPIAGVAWSPGPGIDEVQVRVDNGPWKTADLAVVGSKETWVQWRIDWDASPGRHLIEARAINGNGDVQSAGPRPVAPDGAEGYHRIEVQVS